MTNMGDVTQFALNAIIDNDRLENEYSSPEAVLKFLRNDSNFKGLKTHLREVMEITHVCSQNDSVDTCARILFDLLKKQDDECGIVSDMKPITTERWLSGYTKTIGSRILAIKICFALNLDKTIDSAKHLEITNGFLNKCGFNKLNVRSADDATFLYCILNGKSLATAYIILSEYDSASKSIAESSCEPYVHSGDTTLILERELMANSNWSSDSEFLTTFLIPNKNHFIGYAATAELEYYTLKNKVFLSVLLYIAEDERHFVDERKENSESNIGKGIINVSLAVRSALRKCSNEHILFPAKSILNDDLGNTIAALLEIKRLSSICTELDFQKQISVVIHDIMTERVFLKSVIVCLDRKNPNSTELRKKTDSEFKESILLEFPYDRDFQALEKNPHRINQNMHFRKAIILMYYIAYAYEFTQYITDYTYISELFGDMSFTCFMDGLNKILVKCKLSKLYPADRFDWLILRSVREFEVSDYCGEDDRTTAFFDDVLAFSFGITPNND